MNDPHSYPQPRMRLPPKDQLVMGIHAVRELLLYAPERLLRIFLSEKKEKGERFEEILRLSEECHIPLQQVPFSQLTRMVSSDSHQSIVAHIKGRTFLDVKNFLKTAKETSLVLMLDQIFDPQNFGAILRSAECLGAAAVAWSKNRGSDLTPVVAKASSGASELLPLIRISNLVEAASQFQEGGFELVATLADPAAENLFHFSFSSRTLLILGSEGEGIQPLLRKRTDRMLYIPMAGKIDSLNVAAAASVLLTMFRCQREGQGRERVARP